nr:substrate-binding domain-containing protein [Mycobacterium tuberculosis]
MPGSHQGTRANASAIITWSAAPSPSPARGPSCSPSGAISRTCRASWRTSTASSPAASPATTPGTSARGRKGLRGRHADRPRGRRRADRVALHRRQRDDTEAASPSRTRPATAAPGLRRLSRGRPHRHHRPPAGRAVRLLARFPEPAALLNISETCRTENDTIAAVASGKADAAPGLQALALQFGLGFVPTQQENFDLLVCRKAWF